MVNTINLFLRNISLQLGEKIPGYDCFCVNLSCGFIPNNFYLQFNCLLVKFCFMCDMIMWPHKKRCVYILSTI